MDRRPPRGESEWRIDGNEVGPGLGNPLQNFFVAEGDVSLGPLAAEYANARRAVNGARQVDANNDKRFATSH
jgi:hypothetical protein